MRKRTGGRQQPRQFLAKRFRAPRQRPAAERSAFKHHVIAQQRYIAPPQEKIEAGLPTWARRCREVDGDFLACVGRAHRADADGACCDLVPTVHPAIITIAASRRREPRSGPLRPARWPGAELRRALQRSDAAGWCVSHRRRQPGVCRSRRARPLPKQTRTKRDWATGSAKAPIAANGLVEFANPVRRVGRTAIVFRLPCMAWALPRIRSNLCPSSQTCGSASASRSAFWR